jgi:hypothetical protein
MRLKLIHAAFASLIVACGASPASADAAAATKAYAKLLSQYVTPRGVKYDAWRSSGADIRQLSEILMLYRSADPKTLQPNELKALYINLYNTTVFELVLRGNPRGSIRELSKGLNPSEIFNRNGLNFDGKMISLNDLEKRLREEFKDPRVHFALNCASKSCPPVRPEPFTAATLDAQLDDAARRFLASRDVLDVRLEHAKAIIVAPKIFEWYSADFKAAGGPLGFIEKYGPAEAAEAIAGGKAKLTFADYDWDLNSAK